MANAVRCHKGASSWNFCCSSVSRPPCSQVALPKARTGRRSSGQCSGCVPVIALLWIIIVDDYVPLRERFGHILYNPNYIDRPPASSPVFGGDIIRLIWPLSGQPYRHCFILVDRDVHSLQMGWFPASHRVQY